MKLKSSLFFLCLSFLSLVVDAQTEFKARWKDVNTPIIIDPYEKNSIDTALLKTDTRVVAIIHRASIGMRKDKKYEERKKWAIRNGFKWGSYHLGVAGEPIKQAEFYLQSITNPNEELIALDIENIGGNNMSLDDAVIFINYIYEKIGRYPFLYCNDNVMKTISRTYGKNSAFYHCPLWYARFRSDIPNFTNKIWRTYTIWQFSCEINCKNGESCLYRVKGTQSDMDVNVYNGTVQDLLDNWPTMYAK